MPLATVTGEYDGVPIGTAVRMIEGTLLDGGTVDTGVGLTDGKDEGCPEGGRDGTTELGIEVGEMDGSALGTIVG